MKLLLRTPDTPCTSPVLKRCLPQEYPHTSSEWGEDEDYADMTEFGQEGSGEEKEDEGPDSDDSQEILPSDSSPNKLDEKQS